MSDKPKVLIVEVGTIGHVDHGKTTLGAVLSDKIHETKRTLDEITEDVDIHQGIQTAPEPFIIKNYRADYEVNQTNYLTGKQMRNQRRKQNRKNK